MNDILHIADLFSSEIERERLGCYFSLGDLVIYFDDDDNIYDISLGRVLFIANHENRLISIDDFNKR